MRKDTIIAGSRYKDYWGRTWFAVEADGKGWTMKMEHYPYEGHFTFEEIKNLLQLIER